MTDPRWQFWIDRGGTFTDCIGSRDGEMRTAKVLSSDRAPLIGIRQLLGLPNDAAIPPCDLRMGTTLATNALLERQGTPTALLITSGFRDLLAIGTQARPDLFALDIEKPELLYQSVVEVDARIAPDGSILRRPNISVLRNTLQTLRQEGIESLAVVVLHSYKNSALEVEIGECANALGFPHVSLSSEVTCEMGMLGRGDTSVVDAYLSPLIHRYVQTLQDELPGTRIQIMQSSGGLTSAQNFRGKNAILSGPAGGVIAYAAIARRQGYQRAIGFDMGGTSTDVSCFDGELEHEYETEVAGVRLRAPMMSIHTAAAGGGSVCADNGFRFTVGPRSVGSVPGPLCYGHKDAHELSVTDCNLALGRVIDDRFPFPLDRPRVMKKLETMSLALHKRGIDKSALEVATGFLKIANANMGAAIREVTIAKGRDLRDFAMVVFGGAGGQHGCAVARQLGIRTLIVDELSGVLSAYGMGLASLSWHGQEDAGQGPVSKLSSLDDVFRRLENQGRAVLVSDGAELETVECIRRIDLRYRGTDTPITVGASTSSLDQFVSLHRQHYGYVKDAIVEMMTARVEVLSPTRVQSRVSSVEEGPSEFPSPLRTQPQWHKGVNRDIPVYAGDSLRASMCIVGPALIVDSTGTLCLDEGWQATVGQQQQLVLHDNQPEVANAEEDLRVDPIRLEIFNNLFRSTAIQMGNTLRDTAVSTNIRERLDFSCAVFDAAGGLVANAPHIPVHLGAMGESIRGVLRLHPSPPPGSVYATNDPSLGGSHLPDITVVTPVHDAQGKLLFFTANRGHHADIGGITPGSMPPFSKTLEEEGVVLHAMQIVRDGSFLEKALVDALNSAKFPVRKLQDNLSDLRAQIAANQRGADLLRELLTAHGTGTTLAYMGHVQDNAAEQVAASIRALADGRYHFADVLDDGTPIAVHLEVSADKLAIDFRGTGPQSETNLNAPKAVTLAAVLYVLRCMIGSSIPLNSGCMREVSVAIPDGCLLDPDPGRAVVAGNVETSQRIVDVLLASLDLAAASQGTMNNLSFGDTRFGYYETIAGGAGATPHADGASGVHTHMTNTRITDPEILESRYPVRLLRFELRRGSGGDGLHHGGDGVIRELEAMAPLRFSILSERRSTQPFGLGGGSPGMSGRVLLNDAVLDGPLSFEVGPGDRIRIETPGGGGYGPPEQ